MEDYYTIAELAHEFGVSKTTINNKIHDNPQISKFTYKNRRLLNAADRLIIQNDLQKNANPQKAIILNDMMNELSLAYIQGNKDHKERVEFLLLTLIEEQHQTQKMLDRITTALEKNKMV
jgi:DNA-binding LacI/PurR family transcriptional regulator